MAGRIVFAYILAGIVIVALVIIPLRACANMAAALGPQKVPTQEEFEQLKAQGDAIIVQIEAYKQSQSEYPISLEDAAIVVPQADYGGWQYVRTDKGGFELSIGQYTLQSSFTLLRREGDERWYIDR